MATADTDVLVVGGGPVGLALALELGLQGRRCLLVERHDRVGSAPRAKTTNVRSRELMRRWGIADRLAAASPFGVDYPSDVVFATRLAGRELARFRNAFYCAPVRDDRFAEHAQWIPQYKVEEVLRARAAECPGVRMDFATELLDWTDGPAGVEARLRGVHDGRERTVRARYLVGIVQDLAMRNVKGRLARLLLDQAEAAERGTPLPPLTQEEIASHLGTVREVVGRAMRSLAAEGVITVDRQRIEIADRTRLLAAAEV